MIIPFLSLVLLAGAAWAQTAAPPQPPLTQLKTYLALTDSQVQALQTIRSQVRSSTSALRQQMVEKQRAMNQASAAGAGAAELGQYLVDIQSLRKQIADAEALAQPQALAVLTEAQKTKLQALADAAALRPAIREAEAVGLIALPAGPGLRGGGAPGDGRMGPMGFGRGRAGGSAAGPRR